MNSSGLRVTGKVPSFLTVVKNPKFGLFHRSMSSCVLSTALYFSNFETTTRNYAMGALELDGYSSFCTPDRTCVFLYTNISCYIINE